VLCVCVRDACAVVYMLYHCTMNYLAVNRRRQKKAILQHLILNEVGDVCAFYDVQGGKILGVGISGIVQVQHYIKPIDDSVIEAVALHCVVKVVVRVCVYCMYSTSVALCA
jgi:hypothetical protein